MYYCYTHNWSSTVYDCPQCNDFVYSTSDSTALKSHPQNETPIEPISLKPNINSSLLIENIEVTFREDVTCFGNRFWIQVEDSEFNDNAELRQLVGKTFKAKLVLEEK